MTCAYAVRGALKKFPGVESVEVSLNKGLATVTLKPGNTIKPQDFWEAVRKNGFTPKETRVVVAGEITGGSSFKVAITNQELELQGDPKILAGTGKPVIVEGTLSPGKDLKAPVPLRVKAVRPARREMDMETAKPTGLLSYLSLFTSFGTLLCCALPSLLVLFGLGATVASFLSAAPWLVTLSHHKNWVFAISGVLISGNFLYVYLLGPRLRARALACSPDDPRACEAAGRLSRIILWISGVIYAAGFFSAYVLGRLLERFG